TVIITVLWMGFPSLAQAVIDDPIAYWSFDDSQSGLENQVTPGSYNDAAVLKGLPTFGLISGEAGIVGNAMVLDGASAIELPYHQDNLGPSFTIAMWYWQQTNDTRMALYQSKDSWNVSYEALEDDFYTNFASYVGQIGAGAVSTSIKTWIHMAHSFSTVGGTTTLSVYTNGVLALTPKSVSSNTMYNVNQVGGLNVGAHRDGLRIFKGMIDELALWDRPLSAAEVAALCQQGRDGLTLGVTQGTSSRIDLQNSQWSYTFSVDGGLGGGVYQSGWLANYIQDVPVPQRLEDTAARLDDTAGNVDGPFHAEALDPKFKIPITTGLRNITLGDFTIETRFRTTDAARGVLIGNFTNGTFSALNLELLEHNKARFYFRKPPAGAMDLQFSGGSVDTRDGAWHHLAGIRKSNTLYLYLDGQELGQMSDTAGSFSLGGIDYFLKGDSRNDVTVFNGDMEDARLWNRALTTNELAAITAGDLPGDGTVASSNMLAQYIGMYSPHDATYASPRHKFALVKPLTYMTRTNFTLEAWFRSTSTERGVLLGCYPARSDFSCVNIEVSSDQKCRLYIQPHTSGYSNYSLWTAAHQNIKDGQWHHMAGVRRDGTLYLYLDGQQKATHSDPTGSFDLTTQYMYVGRDFRTGETEYDGDLREARMWSRALTASEITSIVAGKKPGDPEVAIDGLLTEHTIEYSTRTNTLAEAGYEGSRFLRSYLKGINKLSFVFENLPPHKEISLGALLSQLDSLDPMLDGDHFSLLIDGTEVLNVGLGYDADKEPQVDTLTLFGESADIQLIKDTQTLGGENLFY
ncbi:MAG: LamG domain-containing protein, partial [Kiritimatiellae bacterium]|nr:LamG domain-containing protein [Kiritimatiellia bacterium]